MPGSDGRDASCHGLAGQKKERESFFFVSRRWCSFFFWGSQNPCERRVGSLVHRHAVKFSVQSSSAARSNRRTWNSGMNDGCVVRSSSCITFRFDLLRRAYSIVSKFQAFSPSPGAIAAASVAVAFVTCVRLSACNLCERACTHQ